MSWRSAHTADTWRVSYDPGTTEPLARNNTTNREAPLTTFATRADADEALRGWAQQHHGDDGIGWLSEQLGIDTPAVALQPQPHPGPPPILIDTPSIDLA